MSLVAFIRANPAPTPNPGKKRKSMRTKTRRNAGVTKRESRKVSAWARALKQAGGNSKKASRIYRGKSKRRSAPKARRKVKRGARSWRACMKTAGGNAKLASKLYQTGRGCSTMRKVTTRKRKGLRARARTRRATKSYGRHSWSECMRAAGGNAKLASRYYRQTKVACSKLRKVSSRTRTAKAKRARHRRSVKVETFAPGVVAEPNPRRRSKKKTRRSAKKMPKRNKKGQFVKSGRKRKSTSRRRKSARPRKRSASRRKSSRRRGMTVTVRSNPCAMPNPTSIKGAFTSIKRTLTSTRYLAQLGTGAASAAANAYVGGMATGWIQQRVDFFAGDGWAAAALRAVSSVASGALTSLVVPKRYRNAWLFGAGIAGFLPLVEKAIAAARGMNGLSGAGVTGLGDYLTVRDCRRIAAQSGLGVGDYMTVRDARRMALRAA